MSSPQDPKAAPSRSASADEGSTATGIVEMVRTVGSNGLEFVSTVARELAAAGLRELAEVSRHDPLRWIDGLKYLRRAIQMRPEDASLHAQLGELLVERGDAEEAREAFRQALENDFRNVAALRGMGAMLHREGELPDAAYYYLASLSKEPEDLQVLLNLGLVLEAQGNYTGAIKRFEQSEALAPELALPHLLLGRALLADGQVEASARALEKAVALAPEDGEVRRQLAYALDATGKRGLAIEELERAVDLAPSDGLAHLNLAQLLNLEDRGFKRALQEAEEACRLFRKVHDQPRLARGLWEIGWAYYRLGRYDESIAASREALSLEPGNRAVRFNLALAQLRKGDTDAARATYAEALEGLDELGVLKGHAIADLEYALVDEPDLAGGHEILKMLMTEREALKARQDAIAQRFRSAVRGSAWMGSSKVTEQG